MPSRATPWQRDAGTAAKLQARKARRERPPPRDPRPCSIFWLEAVRLGQPLPAGLVACRHCGTLVPTYYADNGLCLDCSIVPRATDGRGIRRLGEGRRRGED